MTDERTGGDAEPDESPPGEGDAAWREQIQRTQDDGSPQPPPPHGIDPRDNHA